MRVIVGEIVAEKSAVWRSAGVAERMASRSSAKPMSSISSASSRMTTRTASRRRLPRLRWSTARPGCRDHDVDPAPEAAQLLADGLTAVDRQDPRAHLATVLREIASATCIASSRVGTRTSAEVAPVARRSRWRCAGGSAARRRRSCRSRSVPRPAGRDRRAAAGSPRAGSGSAPRSRGAAIAVSRRGSSPRAAKPSAIGSSGRIPIASAPSRPSGSTSASPGCGSGSATGTIVAERDAVSVPRRPVRGRSSGRGASRRCRCARSPRG